LLRPAVGVMRGCSQVRSGSSGSLDTWHHGPDSASMPAVNQKAVTLVNMRFCPYAQRTALCLNAKNIQYDIINSQLKNKPSWLWDLNPIGKVPVLIHDGNTIYESLVTCEYIEEVFPGRKLHSEDPGRRARDRMLVELFNKVINPQMRIWFKKDLTSEGRAKYWKDSMDSFEPFEEELDRRGDSHFAGALPGWLDYMVWPWFERVDSYSTIFKGELVFPRERFPLLTKWMEKMKEDPAVSEYFLDTETHAQFINSLAVNGVPNYNILYSGEQK